MQHRSWPTVGLLCIIAMLLGILLVPRDVPLAHAESSEGRAEGTIALTSAVGRDSLLYIVDTNREVILVYGFHVPGSRTSAGGVRTGVFEFLAARLYRWEALPKVILMFFSSGFARKWPKLSPLSTHSILGTTR